MNTVRLFFTRELALVTLTLGAATVAAILMVAARIVYTGQLMFAFLPVSRLSNGPCYEPHATF